MKPDKPIEIQRTGLLNKSHKKRINQALFWFAERPSITDCIEETHAGITYQFSVAVQQCYTTWWHSHYQANGIASFAEFYRQAPPQIKKQIMIITK